MARLVVGAVIRGRTTTKAPAVPSIAASVARSSSGGLILGVGGCWSVGDSAVKLWVYVGVGGGSSWLFVCAFEPFARGRTRA